MPTVIFDGTRTKVIYDEFFIPEGKEEAKPKVEEVTEAPVEAVEEVAVEEVVIEDPVVEEEVVTKKRKRA